MIKSWPTLEGKSCSHERYHKRQEASTTKSGCSQEEESRKQAMQTEIETEEEVATERKGRQKVRRCSGCGGLITTKVCIACRIESSRRREKEKKS